MQPKQAAETFREMPMRRKSPCSSTADKPEEIRNNRVNCDDSLLKTLPSQSQARSEQKELFTIYVESFSNKIAEKIFKDFVNRILPLPEKLHGQHTESEGEETSSDEYEEEEEEEEEEE